MLKYKYKINSLLSRITGLFSRRFKYSYNAHTIRYKAKDAVVGNNKQLWMVSIIIALVVSMYIASNAVTGYITYGQSMEVEYNKTRDLLFLKQSELESVKASEENCNANLIDTEEKLNSCNVRFSESESLLINCESDMNNLKTYSEELNALLNECDAERSEFQEKYENASTTLSNLIDNTVALICCRPGIETSEWDMINDEIVCSGSYSIDCNTGELTY